MSRLFVGVTSWNSELFLPHCIQSILNNTKQEETDIVVYDNSSEDNSVRLARELGARVIIGRCSQGDALNRLASLSRSEFTLLVHADVILLYPEWLRICSQKLSGNTVLVSPEDIGCGPLTRPFGAGMPESSFLLFKTSALKQIREIRWRRIWRFYYPHRDINFFAPHVTHKLPEILKEKNLHWHPMSVHWSDHLETPIWVPGEEPRVWNDELGYLRYGLGNFYSLDGIIIHYHNWYDRKALKSNKESSVDFHPGYVNTYTELFLQDWTNKRIVLPPAVVADRTPVAL